VPVLILPDLSRFLSDFVSLFLGMCFPHFHLEFLWMRMHQGISRNNELMQSLQRNELMQS
jgi:hypothetical protein